MHRPRARLRLLTVAAALVGVTALVSACSSSTDSGDKGFVDAGGIVTRLAADKRAAPAEPVTGTTLEGEDVSLEQYAGKVVVLNVWGSWCGPCRAEAPALVTAARQLQPDGVVFLGINVKDTGQDTALAFERRYDVPYPSLYDPSGETLLAFRKTLPPNAIPSTVVVDADGKVAASILGRVPSVRTLVDLVQDVQG